MGNVVDFPMKAVEEEACQANTALREDPYYRFIRSVLQTADACGFGLPFTVDSAAEHVYHKTRDSSELARLLSNSAD